MNPSTPEPAAGPKNTASGPGKGIWNWLWRNRVLFIGFTVITAFALIPLYFVLFPPVVDLGEHILISKLLWEKLAGVTHLDLQVSPFIGYRLLPYTIVAFITVFRSLGISLIYMPKTMAFALIALHSAIVVTILYFTAKEEKARRSFVYAALFALPAVSVMYSACWHIGFVNFTLGISFVVLAVGLTEWFLRDGKAATGLLLFVSLLLAYMSHPFAPVFWVAWGFWRGVMSIAARNFLAEWKRLLMLPLFFLPILIYNYIATKNTELAPRDLFVGISPFVSFDYWWHTRMGELVDGSLLAADDASSGVFFAWFILIVICATLILSFVWGSRRLRAIMLTCITFSLFMSCLNEKFFPTPGVHWLAYDYRFYSTTTAVCLTMTGVVLLRLVARSARSFLKTAVLVIIAVYAAAASTGHIVSVWRAYERFDPVAREYTQKVFNNEQPTGIYIHTQWNPDGSYLGHLRCLKEPDCIPPSSSFHNYGGDLFAVKVMSQNRIASGPLFGYWRFDETNPSGPLADSSGMGYDATPRGTSVVEGKFNKARGFNGTSDYIDIRPIDIPTAITVAAWVYSDNFSQNGYIILKNPVNKMWALLLRSDGTLRWRGVGDAKEITCPVPGNSEWHHIAATQDGSDAVVYIDGKICNSGEVDPIGNSPPSAISVGRYDTINYDYFSGRIDELRLYDRALSASEISELMSGG